MKKLTLFLLFVIFISSCAPSMCKQHIKEARKDMKKGIFYK